MKYISEVAALSLLTTLAACVPLQPNYMPPPNLTLQTGARVVGSITIDPSPFVPNTEAALSAVDNQSTGLGRDDWKMPTLMLPGMHILTISICKCSKLAGYAAGGAVTLLAMVKSDSSYTIRTTALSGFSGYDRHFVTVWVEDETGASITPKTKFELDKSNPPIAQLFEH
jgi:hypothetical protein